MPQTLMRPSATLMANECEIQAASALRQMKEFSTMSSHPSFSDRPSGFLFLSKANLSLYSTHEQRKTRWLKTYRLPSSTSNFR